jgi:hypothetical protein
MREVFTHREFARVGHYQSILESEGIGTYVRNETSHNLFTWIPIPILNPVLCVDSAAEFESAVALLQSVHAPEKDDPPDWMCVCGEEVPGNFDVCWKCGAELTTPQP